MYCKKIVVIHMITKKKHYLEKSMNKPVMVLVLVFSITLPLMTLSGERQNSRPISLPSENQHDHTYTIERSKKIYPSYRIITYKHHLMPSNTVITVKQRTEKKTKEESYSGHEKKCSSDDIEQLQDPQTTFKQCQILWRQVHQARQNNCSLL